MEVLAIPTNLKLVHISTRGHKQLK